MHVYLSNPYFQRREREKTIYMRLQIKLLLSKGSNGRSFTRVRVLKAMFVVHSILYDYFGEYRYEGFG